MNKVTVYRGGGTGSERWRVVIVWTKDVEADMSGMNEMRSSLESELANWRTGGLADWRATWSKSSGADEDQTFSGVRGKRLDGVDIEGAKGKSG